MPDNVHWEAVYADDSKLKQYDDKGKGRKYTDIDRSKLKKFILYKDDEPVIVLNLTGNKKLIYRRRVAKQLGTKKEEVVYLVGWQEKVGGKNVQSISFLFEDGHIEVLDRFKENHAWYGPVKFLPDENVD